MKLILLYGAPATGKLTIASELSKRTGYTLIHNHIILNALSEIFGYDHPARRKLEKEFRLRIFEEAAKANINIIATGVIMKDNEDFYLDLIKKVKANHGVCYFVHLSATHEVLQERIGNESRISLNKISTKERLKEWSEQYPESYEIRENNNQISIDTSNGSPREVAAKIIEHYKL